MLVNMRAGLQTIKRVMFCAGLITGVLGHAPTTMAAVGGTPAYQVEAVPFQWIDASTGTKQVPGTVTPIGFNFQYYGVTYNSLAVQAPGFLTMGADVPSYNAYTPIMPYLDPYLDGWFSGLASGGAIYTKLEGSAPNRKFTVSWIDVSTSQPADYCGENDCPWIYYGKMSFQVTLHEGSNDIIYQYLDVIASDEASAGYTNHDNGVTATVGVANAGRDEGTLHSVNQPVITNGSALRFFVGPQPNLSPIADAGPDLFVNQGDTGALFGGGSSDSNGTITKYSWAQEPGQSGAHMSISNANSATASFTAAAAFDTTGTVLPVKLTVTDNQGAYSTDRANVTVRNIGINQLPVANAGPDQTVNEGDWVFLVGSGVDPEGFVVTYLWTQIAGPKVAYAGINDWTSPTVSFYAPAVPADTVLTFKFTATDLRGGAGSDTVNVKIRNAPNKPPVANAGPDSTVKQKTTVSLNGSGSYDTDGTVVSYSWRQIAGKAVELKNVTSAMATFTAPSTTQTIPLTFELTVTDNNGATTSDQVVTVVTR